MTLWEIGWRGGLGGPVRTFPVRADDRLCACMGQYGTGPIHYRSRRVLDRDSGRSNTGRDHHRYWTNTVPVQYWVGPITNWTNNGLDQ